jgi:vacuolar-type H+-ATPase subunit I/STV1
MTDLAAVLEQLKKERKQVENKLRKLEDAIAVLCEVVSEDVNKAKHKSSRLSETARARISTAQKLRWAKMRERMERTK